MKTARFQFDVIMNLIFPVNFIIFILNSNVIAVNTSLTSIVIQICKPQSVIRCFSVFPILFTIDRRYETRKKL